MKKNYIPFLAFTALLLLTIPFSFDFATSVVPGWRVTVFPPYFWISIVVIIVLLLAIIGYWLLSKRVDRTNRILFIIHIILTTATVAFLVNPSILLNIDNQLNENEFRRETALRIKLIPVAWVLFALAQILFLIYFVRTIRTERSGERAEVK